MCVKIRQIFLSLDLAASPLAQSPPILRFQILNNVYLQQYPVYAVYDLLTHRSSFYFFPFGLKFPPKNLCNFRRGFRLQSRQRVRRLLQDNLLTL